MDFEKDQFEDDDELSRLEEDDEPGGEGIVEEEEEEILAVEDEAAEEGGRRASGASCTQGGGQEDHGAGSQESGQEASEKGHEEGEGQAQSQESGQEGGEEAPPLVACGKMYRGPLGGIEGPFFVPRPGWTEEREESRQKGEPCQNRNARQGGSNGGTDKSKRRQDNLCYGPSSRYGACAGARNRT